MSLSAGASMSALQLCFERGHVFTNSNAAVVAKLLNIFLNLNCFESVEKRGRGCFSIILPGNEMKYNRELRIYEDGMSDVCIDDFGISVGMKRAAIESLIRKVQNLEMGSEVLCQLDVAMRSRQSSISRQKEQTYVYPSQRCASCAEDSIILSR